MSNYNRALLESSEPKLRAKAKKKNNLLVGPILEPSNLSPSSNLSLGPSFPWGFGGMLKAQPVRVHPLRCRGVMLPHC